MKKKLLFFMLIAFISGAVNADILTELAKRDRKNPIRIGEYTNYVLFAEDGYLYTEYWNDGMDTLSIIAYQIHDDSIKLIIRSKTWDFAYRIFDTYYGRDRIDRFTVDVHNFYLVELVYVNDKLETYGNRIRDININDFIFNETKISCNINKVPQGRVHIFYSPSKITLTEGMEVKIISFTNEYTNVLAQNSSEVETYDYFYHVLIEDAEIKINGYLLDFSDKVEYRSQLEK